jgi:hypothetical protein
VTGRLYPAVTGVQQHSGRAHDAAPGSDPSRNTVAPLSTLSGACCTGSSGAQLLELPVNERKLREIDVCVVLEIRPICR